MAVFPLSAKHRKYALRALAVSIILVSAAYIASTEGTERVRPQRVEQKLPPLSWGGSGVQTAYWVQEAVQPGDSLADVLARSGMARDEIAR
ncbi:TPA: peptidase M23, partial [Neisseria gonorrhoeae]